MSYVTCHVSHVTCHVSHVTCHFFHKVVGLLSTGPTLSIFILLWYIHSIDWFIITEVPTVTIKNYSGKFPLPAVTLDALNEYIWEAGRPCEKVSVDSGDPGYIQLHHLCQGKSVPELGLQAALGQPH